MAGCRRRWQTGIVDNGGTRIGDAERQEAADRLTELVESGHLTVDEHAERLDAVLAARTGNELQRSFDDLPAPAPASVPAERGSAPTDLWQRLSAATAALSTGLFLLCGFAFDGWAWAWVVFLLPGALAAMSTRDND